METRRSELRRWRTPPGGSSGRQGPLQPQCWGDGPRPAMSHLRSVCRQAPPLVGTPPCCPFVTKAVWFERREQPRTKVPGAGRDVPAEGASEAGGSRPEPARPRGGSPTAPHALPPASDGWGRSSRELLPGGSSWPCLEVGARPRPPRGPAEPRPRRLREGCVRTRFEAQSGFPRGSDQIRRKGSAEILPTLECSLL